MTLSGTQQIAPPVETHDKLINDCASSGARLAFLPTVLRSLCPICTSLRHSKNISYEDSKGERCAYLVSDSQSSANVA
jgi:hypothetical protein